MMLASRIELDDAIMVTVNVIRCVTIWKSFVCIYNAVVWMCCGFVGICIGFVMELLWNCTNLHLEYNMI